MRKEIEGGCGVIGFACEEKIPGRHLLRPLKQMRNRGNGKGGGIAAVGLEPEAFGVSAEILENDYLLAVAYLDKSCRQNLEKEYVQEKFHIDHVYEFNNCESKEVLGLDVEPPHVVVYFVRVKKEIIQSFKQSQFLQAAKDDLVEDEIVYKNSYHLNKKYYSDGTQKAFVLSHTKNLIILKLVGYGDDVIKYYRLENLKAHVWIGHHRYPTKGKVWHPGGAHPFIGMHEALVHNGDFANYYTLCEYLAQRDIRPLFLTDTEVSVLLFDLYHRIYRYPLEYVIEAFAPTTERDFTLLTEGKQHIYKMIQRTHIHGSPDGPWFFLIAQSLPKPTKSYSLIGITDTSMLRPQVFALQKGPVAIGLSASEKQAIDATLHSISEEDNRFWPHADHYWSARGGSYTDGGAFVFKLTPGPSGKATLDCENKFGHQLYLKTLNAPYKEHATAELAKDFVHWDQAAISGWNYSDLARFLKDLEDKSAKDQQPAEAIETITQLIDRHYPFTQIRRSVVLGMLHNSLNKIAEDIAEQPSENYAFTAYQQGRPIPLNPGQTLVIDATRYPSEGEDSLAQELVRFYQEGFHKLIVLNCRGQRFIGCGFGPEAKNVRIDVFGSPGDYLASGIDGMEIHVHGSGQDQLAQIMKSGTLVVHGDVGQAFLYGAKGGSVFVLGSAAGRPLINAVGNPKVVINGTCLDYLAESFMAGNPLEGGGFAIINGIKYNNEGEIIELESPYPGSNLFSLASGGCIYIRDPGYQLTDEQLNGGRFSKITQNDWKLILPFLVKNEALFHIPIDRLLQYKGKSLTYDEVYRKISPAVTHVLQGEEAWVKGD